MVRTTALVLGDLKLVVEHDGKVNEFSLYKTGKVTADGKVVAEVTTAGELKVAGEVVKTIAADGTLRVGDDQVFTIRDDGAFLTKSGGVLLEIGDDGAFRGFLSFEIQGKAIITGDLAARRALMFAFLSVGGGRR